MITVTKKISDTSGYFLKTNCNAMITKTEGKTTTINCLASTAGLNAVKNKIGNVSDLVEKTAYDGKSIRH